MKASFFYGSPNGLSYDVILEIFSGTRVNSIRTSTVPLVQFWKKGARRVKKIESKLNLDLEKAKYCFEYPTSPKGKGKSSMTDLMILAGDAKLAIEAKFTEYHKGKDLSLKEWKTKGNKENRDTVTKGWFEMISKFSAVKFSDLDDISYQFLHRTASACYNSNSAYVIYLIFYDSITKQSLNNYRQQLEGYCHTLKANSNLSFYIWEVETLQMINKGIDGENCFSMMKSKDLYSFSSDKLYPV
ncbi:MAG: hypothetical protein RLO17_23035 [Cyclobacteriaceae bacterium]